jgi:protease IV
MKKFFWGLLAGGVLCLVLIIAGLLSLGRLAMEPVEDLSTSNLLVLDWPGDLPLHQIDPTTASLSTPMTLSTVLPAIRKAATDPRIEAILIPKPLSLRRESLHELADAMALFKSTGKTVYAHLDLGLDASYMLACLADEIALSPSTAGGLILTGPGLHSIYRGEMMQKLGVKVNVVHAGVAKGFGEHWSSDAMSAPVRENLSLLLDDIFTQELRWISRYRPIDPSLLQGRLQSEDIGILPETALELALVDKLSSYSDWEADIETHFPDAKRLKLQSWLDSCFEPRIPFVKKQSSEDHIAVLWAEGGISQSVSPTSASGIGSRGFVKDILDLRDDEKVKAVLVRVDSPGGSALASDEIYHAFESLAKEKPLFVSMGSVAASGGYYISLPAEEVWASAATVTGSIGVVALLPDFSETATKMGLHPQGLFSTPLAGFGSFGNEITAQQLSSFQKRISSIESDFHNCVLSHRPLEERHLSEVAEGRVWLGERARKLGLVDSIGNLSDCLKALRHVHDLLEVPVQNYPIQKNLIDLLMSGDVRPGDLLPGLSGTTLIDALPLRDHDKHALEVQSQWFQEDAYQEKLVMQWPFCLQ